MTDNRTRWRRALTTIVAAGLLTAVTTSAASASALPAPRTAVSITHAIRVPMTLNCGHLTTAAASYAVRNGYCRTAGGRLIPNDVATGDCGDSVLYMNNAQGGNARFTYGFDSTAGEVIYRSLDVSWVNWSKNLSSNFPDNSFMGSSHYANQRTDYTASGFVTGVLSGYVVLWWGGTCDMYYPSDYTTVT